MPKAYKWKVLLGGPTNSGKTCFLNNSTMPDDNFQPIGVSFKHVQCVVNEGDTYDLLVWDIKGKQRYEFLYPTFSKGARGAVLCFSLNDRKSFESLTYWIELIRNNLGEISIVLIGTKADLDNQVSDEDIKVFIEKYNIKGFFTSVPGDNTRERVFKSLIKNLDNVQDIFDFYIDFFENDENDEEFKEFLTLFTTCPVCSKQNHHDYLKKFYFAKDQENRIKREKLLELIADDLNNMFYNDIKVGIPCCSCFKKYFS